MKQQLTKLEMLWIRACKSEEPEKRLVSLYRRFYTRCLAPSEQTYYITFKLVELCDNHFPICLMDVLQANKFISTNSLLYVVCISHIQHKISAAILQQTTNFIPPKRFR